jgi:putative DNA primase/helicase
MEDHSLKPSATENKPLKDLYTSYTIHCKDTGSRPCGLNTFSERLRNAGFTIDRRKHGRIVWAESEHADEDVF